MWKKLLLGGILGMFIWGCRSEVETPDPARLGYDFFPLELKQYAIYDVWQVIYTINDPPETTRVQLKEVVVDRYLDATKDSVYIVHRLSRANASAAWQLDSAWTARRTPYLAIRKENNVDFVKLSFPLQEKTVWNGNLYNTRGAETYQVQEFDKPYALSDTIYPKTLIVVQQDQTSLINVDQRKEVYARNTGLIYKERFVVNYDQAAIGTGKIESGVFLKQTLLEIGKE